jgi:hypothetical protein
MICYVRRMVITGCMVLFLSVVFTYPRESYANPPQAVNIAYNANSQILTVAIEHKSASTSYHYIKNIEIKKNGTVSGSSSYNSQPDPKTFTYTYKLAAAKGDTLAVQASCSLWGHKTANLVVGQ